MSAQTNTVEHLPAELDKYLSGFYAHKSWRTSLVYDPLDRRWRLEIHLTDDSLRGDDRFYSLLEYFVRTQRMLVRRASGDSLQCSLIDAAGADITSSLRSRGARYLDDDEKGAIMRRRLALLGLRRHFWSNLLPGLLLWAATLALLLGVFHFSLALTLILCVIGLAVQVTVVRIMSARSK